MKLQAKSHRTSRYNARTALNQTATESGGGVGLAIAQCLGSHTVKQRLARLLLQAHDCFGVERSITLSTVESQNTADVGGASVLSVAASVQI
jgi:hypothetical protein